MTISLKQSKLKEYNQAYYRANRDKLNIQNRAYWAANKEKLNEQSRARRAANPERFKERERIYREKNREMRLLYGVRCNARRRGIEFSLCREDIVIPNKCPVLGIDLDWSAGAFSPPYPTIDRINNAKGYIRGNVAIISWQANRLKGDASIEDLEAILVYMRKYQGG